jgi:hypothetical protein
LWWSRSAGPAALSAAADKPSLGKMKLKLNRGLALSPALTNQYFSGQTASIRHEGLYIEKKHYLVHDSPLHPVIHLKYFNVLKTNNCFTCVK